MISSETGAPGAGEAWGTGFPGWAGLAGLAAVVSAVGVGFEVGGVAGFFHKISDIEEGVAVEADIDERRLHAGKHARHFAVVDGAGEGVFVLALVIDLSELVVFKDGQTRFVRRAGNTNFF